MKFFFIIISQYNVGRIWQVPMLVLLNYFFATFLATICDFFLPIDRAILSSKG